ncbi:MAG: hypothetical protein M9894_08535 [Planctomycetes bacterium]|nr:hypothetical protein [Planctomycetota bacterium]
MAWSLVLGGAPLAALAPHTGASVPPQADPTVDTLRHLALTRRMGLADLPVVGVSTLERSAAMPATLRRPPVRSRLLASVILTQHAWALADDEALDLARVALGEAAGAHDDLSASDDGAARLGADGEVSARVLQALARRAPRAQGPPDLARAVLARWERPDAGLAAPVVGAALNLLRDRGEDVCARRARLIARLHAEEGARPPGVRDDLAASQEAEAVEDLRGAGRLAEAIAAAEALRPNAAPEPTARAHVAAAGACLDQGGADAVARAEGWLERARAVGPSEGRGPEENEVWLEDVTGGAYKRLERRLEEAR